MRSRSLSTVAFKPSVVSFGEGSYLWTGHGLAPLDPSSAEFNYVAAFFKAGRCTPRTFEIMSIEIVGCRDPHQTYLLHRNRMRRQRKEGIKNINFDCDIPTKMAALDRLSASVLQRQDGVKEMLAWCGVKDSVVPNIIENGLTAIGTTDSGFFGTGVYLTLQAEYACMYALGEFSDKVAPLPKGTHATLLLCWVSVGNVYPVTQAADYTPGTWHSKHYVPGTGSLGIRTGFTAHHAAVSKAMKYQVPPDPLDADYDEVVVAESAQTLPQYRVVFKEV